MIERAGFAYVPSQTVALTGSASAEKFAKFIEAIEEDDDVSEVHTNVEMAVEG